MKKQLLSILLVLAMVLAFVPVMTFPADAASDVVASTTDARLNALLDAIDNQNFSGAKVNSAQAKQYMRHFIFDSSFAAIDGGSFNYPNSGPYCFHVTDGTYSADIRGSTGCCAYSYFVSKVVYGTEANDNKLYLKSYSAEGLKELLTNYAQAGEHLRADSSHSVTFISCNASGFYCMSYCGDNNPRIRLEYWTYASFLNFFSGEQIYIYNANRAQNSTSQTDWMPVISASNLSLPTQVTFGAGFNLEGVVSTNVGVLTTVNGYITDAVGNMVMEKSVAPNTGSYNLNNDIDSALKFGKLDVDTYTYHLYAEAANGEKTSSSSLVDQVFTVGMGGSEFYTVKTQECGYVLNIPTNYKLAYCNNPDSKNVNGYLDAQKEAYSISSNCRYVMSDGTVRFRTYDRAGNTIYAILNLSDGISYQIVHDFKPVDEKIVYPTCEANGVIEYECACGATKSDYIPAQGHLISGGKCVRCNEEIKNPFEDLDSKSVYYDAVLWAFHSNPRITSGVDDIHFAPQDSCVRGQVVTFLWRAAGCPEPQAECPFVDVPETSPYYKAIIWAAEENITKGVDATHFAPYADVTRAQFVTFLWRYFGEPTAMDAGNPFVDVSMNSAYYNAIIWAAESGVTNGYGNDDFQPNRVCTRWNVVLFLYRAINQDM